MVRLLVLLAVAGCGAERTPITAKVATLGYSHAPAVVVVGRGPAEYVEPWVAGMRKATSMKIIAEVTKPDLQDYDPAQICREAMEAANVTPIDEIIVLDAVQSEFPEEECASATQLNCTRRYLGQKVQVTTIVTSYRASTCKQIRRTSLPLALGFASTPAPIANNPDTDVEALDEVKKVDTEAAAKDAAMRIGEFASSMSWKVFPTDSSIQRVDGKSVVIAGPLELGDYFVKAPYSEQLTKGVHAVSVARNQTTLELDDGVEVEPGDELHGVTDMITVAGFTGVTGGVVTASGKNSGSGGISTIARWTWDHKPALFELGAVGELIPGLDARHLGITVGGGIRVPYWLSPYAIVELGLGGVYQGDHGARAVAGTAAIGGGIEVRRTTWFAFADARLRGLALGEYTDSEEHPLLVKYEDKGWHSTTVQLGVGLTFK